MENKVKLTPEQIEINTRLMEEAKGFARLDNKAVLPEDVEELLKKRITGELSHEDYVNIIISKYKK